MAISVETRQEYLNIFQSIQKEKGIFLKQGKTFKMMSKRYFTINEDQLIYYKERTSQKVRGIVNLMNCTYEIITDKKNQQAIKVVGQAISYIIWILPQANHHIQFYLYFLSLARQGQFYSDTLELMPHHHQKVQEMPSSLTELKPHSLNNNQQIVKHMKQNEAMNIIITNKKRDNNNNSNNNNNNNNNKNYTLDVISQLNNNQSVIQIESDINIIQTTEKNAPNLYKEEIFERSANSRNTLTQININGNNGNQFRQGNQNSPSKLKNLMSLRDKSKKDCNVETTDDIPNTSFMNQYEFSYYRLDKQETTQQQAQTSRNSSSVGPQKRIKMTKFEQRRSKSSRKEYINKSFQKNLKYTSPFGGDQNTNQLDFCEVNTDDDEVTSSSVDYDQEKLYPARKSLLEFEIEDICNDEIIHHQQNKQLATKKSIKSNYQTSTYQKDKNADILSFDNYQDEDIDDTPPGLSKESPLLFQQLEFRKEFVRNSYSQFQNNAKCIDHYKKVKMSRKLNKAQEGKNGFFISEEDELASLINTESNAPSSSKHLFQLKEMFKKNQIISNLHENRLQDTNSVQSIPGYDNDLEDIYDFKQIEEREEIINYNDAINHNKISSFQLLEDQPYAQQNFVQLDNQIRMQASQMKLSDELSQQYLTFTDTEDCLSLVSEKNNIGQQMNNYQNNGCFGKNIFQSNDRQVFISNSQSIFEVKKDTIIQNKEYFILMASHYIWNGQSKEGHYIISQLGNGTIYDVEISLQLLLITGQIRYLDESMTAYNQMISLIDKKDKQFSSTSQLDQKIILCEAHMGIGLLKVLQDKKLSALSSINTAHNYLTQIKKLLESTKRKVEISEESRNRYLLVDGLFQIGLSLMPGFFSKIFNLLGINIDMKRGISCLTECMEMKQLKSNYARVVLFLFYLESENNILQSWNLVKSSLSLQSASPIFNWLASLYYWKIASSSNAVKFIKQAIDFSEKNDHHPHFFLFELGWFYLSQLKWNQAIILFENMIIQGFNFKQIEYNKFLKKLKASKLDIDEQARDYFKDFLTRSEQNPFGCKVKIMHKCCIAFIIGICYISSDVNGDPATETKIEILSASKKENTQNYLNDQDESNNLIQILSPSNISDQVYSIQNTATQRQLIISNNQPNNNSDKNNNNHNNDDNKDNNNNNNNNIINKINNNNDNDINNKSQQKSIVIQNEKQQQHNGDLFYLWCNIALEIYEKLGDSKTLLDIEFRKIIKLFSTRTYTYLIKFELLYFVKELSKVSDNKLDASLLEIKEFQQKHIKQYQQNQSDSSLIEICSGYLLIIGISYIREKFTDIQELSISTSKMYVHLSQVSKKYQYLSHHAFYWLGMSFKKNQMYQQARYFFDLSKSFKTNLFNLSTRIEANLSAIAKLLKK